MSIIKDGKTYRTLEEQVYYLTKEQARDEVDIQSNREDIISLGTQLEDKQDKLNVSTLPSVYTKLVKVIGFDDQNNLTQDSIGGINNTSEKLVRGKEIYTELQKKQNILTDQSTTERALTDVLGLSSGGILGRNKIDTSPTDYVNHLITSKGVKDALATKQDKLTSASLTEGTLDKAVGFDSLGNLIKGVASSGGTDDYDELDNIPIINQEEVQSLTAFSVGQTISNGTKIHFDTTKVSELTSFLQNLTYTQEGGMVEFLVLTDGGFTFAAYNLSGMSAGQLLLVVDNNDATIVFGTQNGSLGDMSWSAGFNNVDANGDYTVDIDNDTEVQSVNATSGWNGSIVSVKSTSLTPVPSNGNYYRKPDGKIYYYSSNEYHEILVNGLVNYDASIIENSTNAVQGGAVYTALGNKQDTLSPSLATGSLATMLGFDANNDLVLQSASDYLNKYLINSGTIQDFIGYDGNGNIVKEYLAKVEILSEHIIKIYGSSLQAVIRLLVKNDDGSIAMGSGQLLNYLENNTNYMNDLVIPISGYLSVNSKNYLINAVANYDSSNIIFIGYNLTDGTYDSVQYSKSNLPYLSYSDNRRRLE